MATSDGSAPFTPSWLNSDCCPVPIGQLSFCGMACAFIQLLPSGPLWDQPKAEALAFHTELMANACEPIQCAPPKVDDFTCTTLVNYAVYLANVLMDTLYNALWPALREANPQTAVTTLDAWLERLGWEDCYRTACRAPGLGALSPYEVMGECGPIYCPVATPPELECALKQAIVRSLSRLNMGGVRNLTWLNWVIEPLGVVASSELIPDSAPEGRCSKVVVTLTASSPTIAGCKTDLSARCASDPSPQIPAYIDLSDCLMETPAGLPLQIWPGISSAECIVRSILPLGIAIKRNDCGIVAE